MPDVERFEYPSGNDPKAKQVATRLRQALDKLNLNVPPSPHEEPDFGVGPEEILIILSARAAARAVLVQFIEKLEQVAQDSDVKCYQIALTIKMTSNSGRRKNSRSWNIPLARVDRQTALKRLGEVRRFLNAC